MSREDVKNLPISELPSVGLLVPGFFHSVYASRRSEMILLGMIRLFATSIGVLDDPPKLPRVE